MRIYQILEPDRELLLPQAATTITNYTDTADSSLLKKVKAAAGSAYSHKNT